jgi:hypothetical protein
LSVFLASLISSPSFQSLFPKASFPFCMDIYETPFIPSLQSYI